MSTLKKIAAQAAIVAGIAIAGLTAAAPADAGVVVGVHLGHPHRHFCFRHPYACERAGGYAGPVAFAGPRIGVFYAGHGWWDGHRYWAHREAFHGGFRYR